MSGAFIDTNVLVYVYDHRDESKHRVADRLVRQLIADNDAAISMQVVQEFCNVVLHKLKITDTHELQNIIEDVLWPLVKHKSSSEFYQRATVLYERHSLSFYDALIVQAALDLGCTTLYSEDLQAGQRFGGLTVVDPFAAA